MLRIYGQLQAVFTKSQLKDACGPIWGTPPACPQIGTPSAPLHLNCLPRVA